MTEKAPNNPDYLKHHPNAIQDIEKAHIMAEGANGNETEAAGVRWLAKETLASGMNPEDFENDVYEFAKQLPEHYKHTLSDVGLNHDSADLGVDSLVEAIKHSRDQAEKRYKFVDESYDKIKATKR